MGILEVALNLANFHGLQNAVRFIWWSAEEFGLIGSEYHVEHLSDDARQKVALYLNFDMIASPNAGYFVFDGDGNATDIPGPPGSEVIERLYRAYFDSHNITAGSAVFGGSSDYQPFVDVGIPSGGLMTGASGIKTAEGALQ
jgi:Zn-dependent M28 family amino/carboxypeptidase